ncbi:hypothetical protein BASA83_001914 [Batrachochytrium salamandrivorans]|nr:hypothetical protein BASA83_001914 [Batrachochytrium salamandrivorans]
MLTVGHHPHLQLAVSAAGRSRRIVYNTFSRYFLLQSKTTQCHVSAATACSFFRLRWQPLTTKATSQTIYIKPSIDRAYTPALQQRQLLPSTSLVWPRIDASATLERRISTTVNLRATKTPLAADPAPTQPTADSVQALLVPNTTSASFMDETPPVIKHANTRTTEEIAQDTAVVASAIYISQAAYIGEWKSRVKQLRREVTEVDQKNQRKHQLEGSQKVVLLAISSNLIMFFAKLYGAINSGSASMYSEALHSLADVLNESLLMLGISRSLRQPDMEHPYGFLSEKYAWALVSGVGVFFLGGGVSLYHGISGLFSPDHVIGDPTLALWILGASLTFDITTMAFAYRQISDSARKAGTGFWSYLIKGGDPTSVQVFLEDCSSVTGVIIAGICLSLSTYLALPFIDSLGSITIGILLSAVATFLIKRNISGLVERSMNPIKEAHIVRLLEADSIVTSVHDVKSTIIGPEWARFKAEILFNGDEVARRYMSANPAKSKTDLEVLKTLNSDVEIQEWMTRYSSRVVASLGTEVDRLELEIKLPATALLPAYQEYCAYMSAPLYSASWTAASIPGVLGIAADNSTLPAAPISIINYLYIYRCSLQGSPLLGGLFLACSLIFLFVALAATAECFFCPNLSSIAAFLGLPETVSGVTIAALGNGAGDLFATFAAFKANMIPLALGELYGAASLVSFLVAGLVCIARPSRLPRRPFIRDIVAFLGAATLMNEPDSIDPAESISSSRTNRIETLESLSSSISLVNETDFDTDFFLPHLRVIARNNTQLSCNRSGSLFLPPDSSDLGSGTDSNVETARSSCRHLVEEDILSYAPAQNIDSTDYIESTLYPILILAVPVVFKWHRLTFFNRLHSLAASPIVFVLTFTTPVIFEHYFDDYQPLPTSAGPLPDTLAESTLSSAVDKNTHVCDQVDGIIPDLVVLQLALFPVIICMCIGVQNQSISIISGFLSIPVWLLAIVLGAIFSIFMRGRLASNITSRPLLKCLSAMGFIVSMLFVSTVSNELVGLLEVIGNLSGLGPTVLGLTLFALGNSIGELVTNVSIARMGYPTMAIGACYGGPMLNIVLGVGLSSFYMIATTGKSVSIPLMDTTFWMTSGGLYVGLITALIFATYNNFHVDEYFGITLLTVYGVVMTAIVVYSSALYGHTPL